MPASEDPGETLTSETGMGEPVQSDAPANETVNLGSGAESPRIHEALQKPGLEGQFLGRYVVVSQLGAGGMGVVYLGYDPELDRRVALKLLNRRRRAHDDRLRLLREAQAMAKLGHPNVISVFDVGEHDGRVFVAMEFVDGGTLTHTVRRLGRNIRGVVELFLAAGEGLAAAHTAGLVHRDFKPDNVMVGSDGRVRVMDFGLVRAFFEPTPGDETVDAGMERDVDRGTGGALATPLTQAGAIMGTPAYMAPEQHLGEGIDERSDQFSFCVALFEALYEQRPFPGKSVGAVVMAISEGDIQVPDRSDVPAWLLDVLRRGLQSEPGKRWPGMRELLDALRTGFDRQFKRTRSRWLLGTGAALALAASGLGFASHQKSEQLYANCSHAAQAIGRSWSAEARAELLAGFEASKLPYAKQSGAVVDERATKFVDAWATAKRDVCVNSTVEGQWSTDLAARADWCLEEAKYRFEEFVGGAELSNDVWIEHAIARAYRLIDPAQCANADAMAQAAPPPPASMRGDVAKLNERLTQARRAPASERVAALEGVLAEARGLAWPALTARVQAAIASVYRSNSRLSEAEDAYVDAYMLASRAGDWRFAASVVPDLISVVGTKRGRYQDAAVWAKHGETALALGGDPSHLLRAQILKAHAFAQMEAGKLDAAEAAAREALTLAQGALGDEHVRILGPRGTLGAIALTRGRYPDAREHYQAALAGLEQTRGPEHPEFAAVLNDLAIVDFSEGDLDAAKAKSRRALEIWEAAHGPHHLEVARAVNLLGAIEATQRNFDEANDLFERRLRILQRATKSGPDVAEALHNLGMLNLSREAFDVAEGFLRQALEMRESIYGEDHQMVAHTLGVLTELYLERDQPVRALEAARRVHEISRERLDPNHTELGQSLARLAKIEKVLGEHESALAHWLEAAQIFEQSLPAHHALVVQARLAVGEFKARLGQRDDGLAWIERARAGCRDERCEARYRLAADLSLFEQLPKGDSRRGELLDALRRAQAERAAGSPDPEVDDRLARALSKSGQG